MERIVAREQRMRVQEVPVLENMDHEEKDPTKGPQAKDDVDKQTWTE